MSSPYGSAYNHSWGNHTNSLWELRPPQYAPPEPPLYASTPQSPQPPESIPPFAQAILDLTRIVDDFVVENKEINAHSDQRIVTVEDNLKRKIDGLKNDFEHKWDNLQDSIESLINQQQCPLEEECLSDTMVEKHSEQQLQEEMIEDFVEVVEGLSESSNINVTFWPSKQEEHISSLITEEGSGREAGKEPQKNVLQPIHIELNPTATAQATKCPQPVTPPLTKCIFCLHLHHNQPLKHLLPNVSPTHHYMPCRTSRDYWPLYIIFPLHQRHKQPPIQHAIADGSGAGSGLEHLNLGIYTLLPHF